MDVEFIRSICLALPAVTEDVKWGNDLVFSVGAKMFCVTSVEQPIHCSFKVRDEDFEEMSTRDGMIPAPYMARAKWIQVTQPSRLSKKEWTDAIQTSYELVKNRLTKKLRAELGLD